MSIPDRHLSPDDLSFLCVIAWPQNASRTELALYVGDAAGLDAGSLKLMMGRPLPAILGSTTRECAAAGAKAIQRVGGDAFVCSIADVCAPGATLKIRDLHVENNRLHLDLWRHEPLRLLLADVVLLVRSAIISVSRSSGGPARLPMAQRWPMQGYAQPSGAQFQFRSETTTRTSEKLDLHARDGRVFQIDGDKFGYSILGEGRGHSDKANMDRMFDLLKHLVPDAIADDFFGLWTPPPELIRFRIPMMKINQDDPSFAFYSRWVARMYRHIGAIR